MQIMLLLKRLVDRKLRESGIDPDKAGNSPNNPVELETTADFLKFLGDD